MSIQTDVSEFSMEENKPLVHGNVKKESYMSWIMAAGLIVNAAMGAGLLNIAKAFDDAGGIAASSVVHTVCLFIVVIDERISSMHGINRQRANPKREDDCRSKEQRWRTNDVKIVVLLVIGAYAILFICCDKSTSSYEEFVLKKCGIVWQRICSACIILYMYGLSITYFIIIGDQLDRFLTFVVGEHYCGHWYLTRKFVIIVSSILLIFPLCFSKTINFLQIPSMLGVLAIVYVVILVPVEYFSKPPIAVTIKTQPTSWTDVSLVLPTMCFSYQAHVNAVPVFLSLRTRADCVKATLASTIILILSYCFVAICGYLTFGTGVEHDILMNYDPKSPAVIVAVIMIAVKTFTAYPVNLYCGRTAIDSFSKVHPGQSIKRRVIIVCLWFSTTLVGAVFLPNISLAIHYLGALAASFIFIFPGLCLYFHIEHNWIYSHQNLFAIIVAIFYVAVGVFVTILTLVQSLMADIHPPDTPSTSIC